jgi:hypothetical protein
VIAQDTGFDRRLPTGEGLLSFRTTAEARAAAREVAADPARHGRAARLLAEEYFDARRVLASFIERALTSGPRGRPVRARSADPAPSAGAAPGRPGAGGRATVPSGVAPRAHTPAPGPAARLLGRRGVLLVSGMAAGVPGQGGASWAVLQYVLGFLRFGLDVHFVDEMDPSTLRPGGVPFERSLNARYFRRLARRYCLEERATLLLGGTERTVGQSYRGLVDLCGRATVLLNLSGRLTDPELLGRPPERVYLDLDPAFTQLWHEQEGVDMRLSAHTSFVTVGLGVGAPGWSLPTCGVRWTVTLPPVVLNEWPLAGPPRWDAWTTVANWRGYGSIHHEGVHYGQKAHAFRELLELPRRARDRFRVALGIHPSELEDLSLLRRNRWDLLDPERVAGDPDRYRGFVQGSAAEVGVAKTGYVLSRSGWFSDRSACYLASGRPVLAQDTGFGDHLPTGLGLVPFGTLEEAAEGVARVRADYARHARAARRIAEEHLDSERVLPRLLAELAA